MPRPTWEELVQLERGLALLEHEILKVQDWPERPYFCAHNYWYGDFGFRAELSRLVGFGRRDVRSPTDLHEGEEDELHIMSGTERVVRSAGYDAIQAEMHEEEEREGRGVLWTSEAYDVAYRHLYELLPDCRHDGRMCAEIPRPPVTPAR